MNILMISATFPYPPTGGGTPVRTFNLMKYLSQRYPVTMVTQRSAEVSDEDVAALREYVQELVVFPRPTEAGNAGAVGKAARFAKFLWQGTPPSVESVYSPAMQAWIDQWVAQGKGDVITAEHSVNEIFVRPEYCDRIRKTVVDIHSSLYGTCRDQLQTGAAEKPWRDRLNLPLMWRYEQRYAQKFSDVVVTTQDDFTQLQQISPQSRLHIVTNGVDFSLFPPRSQDPGGQKLMFFGAMDYIANVDAAKFLCQEILPAVQQRYPNAQVSIVGGKPTDEVKALGDLPGVTVTGRVPAMVDYLHQSAVCVIPMRTGFGIKNKTLEAMAAGTPVVASDRGLEGLVVDGSDVPLAALRANQVEDYVNAIGQLFENPTLRATVAHNGRVLVEENFTWEKAGQAYEQVLCS